jgi:uncharacterized protein
VAQSTSGLGFGLVAGPVLISTLAHDGLRTSVTLGGLNNLVGLPGRTSRVRWRDAALLFVPAAVTTPLMAALIRRTSPAALTAAAGGLTVLGVVALARGVRAPRLAGRRGALLTGAVSGTMTAVAGIGGPPVALYALNADWPPEQMAPTFQAYFLAVNVVALVTLGLPHPTVAFTAGCVAALVAGALVGRMVAARLDHASARRVVLVLAAASGCVAIVRGLASL